MFNKKREVNSGQYYHEEHILSEIDGILQKLFNKSLTEDMIKRQIDNIRIYPNISSKAEDYHLLQECSALHRLCKLEINGPSVTFRIDRKEAYPYGWNGVILFLTGMFLFYYYSLIREFIEIYLPVVAALFKKKDA